MSANLLITFVLALSILCASAGLQCSSNAPDSSVTVVNDGTQDRCFVSIHPESKVHERGPLPILFWFHGSGSNASGCGGWKDASGKTLADYALQFGFALICGEAHNGQWAVPLVQTKETGPRCTGQDTYDVPYWKEMIANLQQNTTRYDTSRMYTWGCSQGSAFSEYSAVCLYKWFGNRNLSFGTHSSGLKIKGDGIWGFPIDVDNCDGCEYWPVVPIHAPGLKACIFDNYADPRHRNPLFYYTSTQMYRNWTYAGNRAEQKYYGGGHCQISSWMDGLTCMDDGTNKLLMKGMEAPRIFNTTDDDSLNVWPTTFF